MHLKRQKAPKKWPIPRKGTKYIVKPSFNLKNGIPILIILRDLLKLAKNKKEVKKALYSKHILINNKPIMDEKYSLSLFDTIGIIPSKKYYRIDLSGSGKFAVLEIKESEINKKIAKIIDKKILRGKKIQLNFSDGRNFLSDVKCNVHDSAIINLKDKKIEKCLPLKEKVNVIVFEGKHIGERGVLNKIDNKNKMAELEVDKKKVNVLIKQLMAIE